MLPKRFEEPADFKWGTFTDAGGAKIRYGSLQPAGESKGTIVLTTGFREPIEKYFEVIRDMTDRGFSVWAMDWHGQGGSDRYLKDHPQRMYNEDYKEHIDTLHQFTNDIVKKSSGPLILMAHSMGANIGMRYLKEHDGVFDSAIMTSPMCDIKTPGFPRPVAQMLVKAARLGNFLGEYVPMAGDWNEKEHVFFTNKVTSDQARYDVIPEIYRMKPELKMGEATYGWVLQAFNSIDILHGVNYLQSIKTPILMGIAGNDDIVDSAASIRAAGLVSNCIRIDVPGAKHEIWMERDELRAPWLTRVSAFLEERLGQQAPSPKKPKENNIPRPPKMG